MKFISIRTLFIYQKYVKIKWPTNSFFSTSASLQKSFVTTKTDQLCLKGENNSSIEILYLWLRDHCQCSKCYNPLTNQRQVDLLTIDRKICPVKTEIDEDNLKIVWPDDDHESTYNVNWLFNTLSKTRKIRKGVQQILWNAEKINAIGLPTVPYSEFLQTYGLRIHLKNLLTYGFSCIIESPPTEEATKEICERTSLIEETFYGKFWTFSNERMDHADTAFTNDALPAHTDSTYYSQTAGYQVFHCLEHNNGTGGETLLVDGFHALQELKEQNIRAFQFLTDTPIPHHFLDKTDHLYSELPVIQTNQLTGEFVQLRFNPLDRAPLNNLTDSEMVNKFYDSYISLMKIIRKKENELYFKLRPGTVLFVDNFRVMHGRAAFTGKRVLSGCYLTKDDLLSKARVLGLL